MSVDRAANDRAWNDPPPYVFAGLEDRTVAPRPRTQLNKRVAYIPSATTATDSKAPPQAAGGQVSPPVPIPFPDIAQNGSTTPTNVNVFTPPDFHRPSTTPPAGSPPNPGAKIDVSKVPEMDSNEMLSVVDAKILEKLERIQPTLGGRKLEDIKRRLGVMRQQWKDGQLSEMTRKRMYLLAQSMAECDFDEAVQIQVSLIMNSSCEVSQWIVGVKHVILECQAQNVRK